MSKLWYRCSLCGKAIRATIADPVFAHARGIYHGECSQAVHRARAMGTEPLIPTLEIEEPDELDELADLISEIEDAD